MFEAYEFNDRIFLKAIDINMTALFIYQLIFLIHGVIKHPLQLHCYQFLLFTLFLGIILLLFGQLLLLLLIFSDVKLRYICPYSASSWNDVRGVIVRLQWDPTVWKGHSSHIIFIIVNHVHLVRTLLLWVTPFFTPFILKSRVAGLWFWARIARANGSEFCGEYLFQQFE